MNQKTDTEIETEDKIENTEINENKNIIQNKEIQVNHQTNQTIDIINYKNGINITLKKEPQINNIFNNFNNNTNRKTKNENNKPNFTLKLERNDIFTNNLKKKIQNKTENQKRNKIDDSDEDPPFQRIRQKIQVTQKSPSRKQKMENITIVRKRLERKQVKKIKLETHTNTKTLQLDRQELIKRSKQKQLITWMNRNYKIMVCRPRTKYNIPNSLTSPYKPIANNKRKFVDDKNTKKVRNNLQKTRSLK